MQIANGKGYNGEMVTLLLPGSETAASFIFSKSFGPTPPSPLTAFPPSSSDSAVLLQAGSDGWNWSILERMTGIEPATLGLGSRCSTI